MVAKLVAEDGILKGLVLSLDEGNEWLLGRDPDACQLLIEDPAASRKHILIKTTPSGILMENLSHTNPVQVNDEEIQEPRLLKNGDAVKIGSGTYRFYAEPAATLIQDENTQVLNNPIEADEAMPKNASEENLNHLETSQEEVSNLASESSHQQESTQLKDFAAPPEDETYDSIFSEEAKAGLAEINFDFSETGRWLLKVISGPNNGAEFSMQAGNTYLVGTDPNTCDIVFHDNSVSRQHARIQLSESEEITIEDLKSRNGTLIDGEEIQGKVKLEPNAMVGLGTTSFIVYDREGEMQTIISPLMPSIVKALQLKEEAKNAEAAAKAAAKEAEEAAKIAAAQPVEKPQEKVNNALGAFILIAIITGLFVLVGIGTTTLFKSEPVVSQDLIDSDRLLQTAISPFSGIKYTFNKNTGVLLLVGHVITPSEKNQLMYNLQGMKFIKSIDDSGVIIDEYVWRELNPLLAKNPAWSSVNIYSPSPGHFILSGYLQTRKQSEQLWDYISSNFPYLDLLERKLVVEEDVISQVSVSLQKEGFKDVSALMTNGELTLSGFIPSGKDSIYSALVNDFKQIPGVRGVRSFVSEQAPEASMINLSDRYEVTGSSAIGKGNISVVINGRIYSRGDTLDGMNIISIKSNVIFLERDGIKYRIDYK